MNKISLESKKIAGLKVTTTNENNKAIKDLGQVWQEFMEKKVGEVLGAITINPGVVYGAYLNYEGDFTAPYDFIAGVEVNNIDNLPEGFVGVEVEAAEYTEFETIEGDLNQRVGEVWMRIWKTTLNRSYKVDLEVYDYRVGENPDIKVLIG